MLQPTFDYSVPRHDNSWNSAIVEIWNSYEPAAAFFITVFDTRVIPDPASIVSMVVPDACFVLGAICIQGVEHVHITMCLQNEHDRADLEVKLAALFRVPVDYVSATPVYKGIFNCIRYTMSQVAVDNKGVMQAGYWGLFDDVEACHMGSFGNMWNVILHNSRNNGLSARDAMRWCERGFPLYVLDSVSNWKLQAAEMGAEFWNKYSRPRRFYYNKDVLLLECPAKSDLGRNIVYQTMMKLAEYFGRCAASIPFVVDINSICIEFSTDISTYMRKPGIILFLQSADKAREGPQRLVNAILRREGCYANVELLVIVYKDLSQDDRI